MFVKIIMSNLSNNDLVKYSHENKFQKYCQAFKISLKSTKGLKPVQAARIHRVAM